MKAVNAQICIKTENVLLSASGRRKELVGCKLTPHGPFMGALRLPMKDREAIKKRVLDLPLCLTVDKKPKSPPKSKGFLEN